MQRGARKPPAYLQPPPKRQMHQQRQPPQPQQPPQLLNSDNSINQLSSEITDIKSTMTFLNSRIDELHYKIVQQKFVFERCFR